MGHDKHCCNEKESCCGEEHESHHHHHHHHDDCCQDFNCYAEEMLNLADHAWQEVVYKKMKEEIIKNSGDHIDELVRLTVAANRERWKKKMSHADDSCCQNFTNDLRDLMSPNRCSSKDSHQQCKK